MVAVDVLNTSFKIQRTCIKDYADRITYLKEKLSASDLVFEEPDMVSGQLVSFATCSYQTWDSRTIVYAQCDASQDPRPVLL